MTYQATRERLLASTEAVVAELRQMQTLFALKRVIRYDHARTAEEHTESVAEHVFGMHCLVDYFLPLEDLAHSFDVPRIRRMTQYHDIDEIETGDVVGYRKSREHVDAAHAATPLIIARLPKHVQADIADAVKEYEDQETIEARFVRAVDKIEPVFHLYNATGKATLGYLATTKEEHDRIKYPAVEAFPVIKRFADVMTEQFDREGFYQPRS